MTPAETPNRSTMSREEQDQALRDFGMRVRHARQERGYTQNELAETAGVDRKTISRIENSRFSPSLANVFAIAHALNVSVRELMPHREK